MLIGNPNELFAYDLAAALDEETHFFTFQRTFTGCISCNTTRQAMQIHLVNSQRHVDSLKTIFTALDYPITIRSSRVAISLIEQANRSIEIIKNESLRDSVILHALTKMIYLQVANYRNMAACAQVMELSDIAPLLNHIMEEKVEAGQKCMAFSRSLMRYLWLREKTKTGLELGAYGNVSRDMYKAGAYAL